MANPYRQTAKQKIVGYLRRHDRYVSGTELENMSSEWKTKASTISRRARELYEDDRLERRLVIGCVYYKLKEQI